MSLDSRVVWSEGMFLRTQHFQQEQRWVDSLVRSATRGLVGHGWGFRHLRLNAGLLQTGKIGIAEADGILPDGTPFSIPESVDHPTPLELGEGSPTGQIQLAIAELPPGAVAVDPMGASDTGARFGGQEVEVGDSVAGMDSRHPIEIGKPRIRILGADADLASYVAMPMAQVQGVQPDGAVVLENNFIPPCLTIEASPLLTELIEEVDGKLETIATERVGYVLDPRARGTAEVQDILILQLVNRVRPLVRHLSEQGHCHPEDLYAFLVSLTGEVATYGAADRRAPPMPTYQHGDLIRSFKPVIDLLRRLLSEVASPDRKAVPIPLRTHKSGVRTTETDNVKLFGQANFVLAVTAALPAERIRQLFPRQSKIGPIEELQDMVVNALPGINAEPLPVAPRQVPYHAGMIYFELDRASPYWRKLPSSSGLAIHVTGDFPELDMECWAIKD